MFEYFHSINIKASDDLSPGAKESADMVLKYLARNVLLPHWKALNSIPTDIYMCEYLFLGPIDINSALTQATVWRRINN